MTARYDTDALTAFAARLLAGSGLDDDKAGTVAAVLVEADLMGHTTHGLQLLAAYLREIEAGRMTATGEADLVADRGAALTWDGRYLPGPWLVRRAIDAGLERAAIHGAATVAIRRSHHIACLAAYLTQATDRGCLVLLITSDPAGRSVAPFGGLRPVYTPNPVAAGIPTDADPILLDVSMSITTNGMAARVAKAGGRLPHPWIKDGQGALTDDPAALSRDPPGSILPIGGEDHGHKGFALGLLVEALTAGLGGFGRADGPEHWGAAVLVQIYDPGAFGGDAAFRREMGWLAAACRDNPVRDGDPPVRLPGARGLALKRRHLADGVPLPDGVADALAPWADRLGAGRLAPLP